MTFNKIHKVLLLLATTTIVICNGRHFSSDKKQWKTGKKTLSTNCGDVLHGSSGSIMYKRGEPFGNNERCSWIVYVPNSHAIRFVLQENGIIQHTEDKIKIGYFQDSEYSSEEYFEEMDLNHNSEDRSLDIPGPVALVRFFSDDTINGLGFRLDFHDLSNSSSSSTSTESYKYSNYFFGKKYGMIQYPSSPFDNSSDEEERVLIVIKPQSPVYVALKYLDGSCDEPADQLTLYQRIPSDSQSLVLVDQFCSSAATDVPTWILSHEIIVTFQTTASSLSRGFQLIWVPSA